MRFSDILAIVIIVGVGFCDAFGQGALIGQLGCGNCHGDLQLKSNLKDLTPDLSSAGLRYDAAWLFEFLRNPARVKRHLGPARMPDFHFSDREAVALIAFLATQRTPTDDQQQIPSGIQSQIVGTTAITAARFHTTITNGLICLSCHTFEGKGGSQGIELSSISYRLQPAWVKEYLVAPSRFGVPHSVMPAQFFEVTNQFRELTPDAAQKIHVIASYLSSLNSQKRESLRANYDAAKGAFPEASTDLGRRIFISQNCAACHRHHDIQPRAQAGPELTKEAARVSAPWLVKFLKQPHPIRPFGYYPGDGNRMPDFRLSDAEVAELAAVLGSHTSPSRKFQPQVLSAFSKRKAKLLLAEKLSCVGCHRFGENGGRIGPDLTHVRNRLQPDYVNSIIRNPREANPHAIMPQILLTESTVKLIWNFLLQHDEPSSDGKYLSLTENPIAIGSGAELNYARYCAGCHGTDGQGNGFNAAFLPRKPTAHASAAEMSRRPDDTLYDAIHSGGYIVNKSHLMPPWGQSLSPTQIKELVAHIRTLCQCSGPVWSQDNLK